MAPIDEDIGQMAPHEIGAFVRGRVNPKAASFPELETPEMYKVVNGLREHYEWNMHDPGVKRWIWDIACKFYSDFKHDCHKCFLREGVDCLPADFKGREDCWTWLCGHFVSPRFLNYSKANTKNRDKLKRLHHLGARSIAYLVWSIRTGQESGQDINPTFPKISAYCKCWCRDGTEYDQYRPNGDALWAKVTERMNAYRVLHPECSEVEVTEAVQQQEDDIFEEVIVQTKGGANMRFLGRAGKGKRLRSGSASGSSSCTGPSQTISQPPTGPSDAELLAQALEQIKDLQQRMQAMESTKKKKQPVQVEEDEDEDDDDDDHTGIPGGWSPSVGRTPGSDMVFVRTPRNQQEESSDDDE